MNQIRSKIVLVAGFIFVAGIIFYMVGKGAGEKEREKLTRNEWGEGELEKEMHVTVPQLSTEYSLRLTLPERKFTEEEEQEYLKLAKREIKATFFKESDNPNAVYESVNPKNSYQNNKVDAEWRFDNYDVVNRKGEILLDQISTEGEVVNASVQLECGESQNIYQFAFCVLPKQLTRIERLKKEAEMQIMSQDTSKKEVILPKKAVGYELIWSEKEKPFLPKLMGFVILCVGVMKIWEKEKIRDDKKIKQEQMRMDYPDFVSKLSLLLGAGMTVSAALKKMDGAYRKTMEQSKKNKREVYEELIITMNEIENGMGEYKAYSRFGERCGLWQYRRLCALVIQSQRMGNRKLIQQLNTEAVQAFDERKITAKKRGEEASTKLLFPMMLMMLLIMGLIMVPAYFSIQM